MMFNRLRLGNLSIYRGGVYLPNDSLVRIIWPGNSTWMSRHCPSTILLESIAGLQGLLSAIQQYRCTSYTIYCDNAGACHSFRKGYSRCAYTWTILEAIDDVASVTMSMVSFLKTRRCSGFEERVYVNNTHLGDFTT